MKQKPQFEPNCRSGHLFCPYLLLQCSNYGQKLDTPCQSSGEVGEILVAVNWLEVKGFLAGSNNAKQLGQYSVCLYYVFKKVFAP